METKHTPGKWEAQPSANELDWLVQVDKGQTILCTCEEGLNPVYRNIEEAKANAKICAAAPDLLHALNEMVETLRPYICKLGVKKGFNENVVLAQALTAIHKATN